MSQRWKFTPHAIERMEEMGVERLDIIKALNEPEIDHPAHAHLGRHRRIAVKGPIAVVYGKSSRTVVTVLWHTEEGRLPASMVKGT